MNDESSRGGGESKKPSARTYKTILSKEAHWELLSPYPTPTSEPEIIDPTLKPSTAQERKVNPKYRCSHGLEGFPFTGTGAHLLRTLAK